MCSSPRFTCWEPKPTIRTRVPLHALRVERSNLPSGHAFLSTLYGLSLTYHQNTHSSPRFTGWGQTNNQNTHSSPRFTGWGQTYHQNMCSSPRLTDWEVKPTMRTCVLLHTLRVERSNLPSGHAFFSTLYGWRVQTYHEDKRSSPRSTGWEDKPTIRSCVLLHALRVEVKPTIRTRIPLHAFWVQVKPTMRASVLLHALRVERSNLPSGHVFFSTLYGLRSQTYYQDMCSSPRFTGWEVKPTIRTYVLLHALRVERSNLPWGQAFLSTLYGLRGQTYHQVLRSSPRFTGWEFKPTIRTCVLLHALRVERSNLLSGHVFLSTLYGLRGRSYHQDMYSSPRFTGWEVKPTIRTYVLLHALRVERSNLPWGQAFFSTLYGLRGQTYHQVLRSSPRFTGWGQTYHQNTHSSPRFTGSGQAYHEDKRSSPRFTGWEVKPTIRTCVLLRALRVERSNLPSGHVFLSTLYGLRGQTYHEDMRSSPRFTGWEVKPTITTCVLLHALRVESSNLPWGQAFFSTLYGLRGQTYHQVLRSSPRLTGWGQTYHQNTHSSPRFTGSGQTYHEGKRSSPRFTGWEVKPTIRTCVLLHALRVERSNLLSGHVFLSTLYGLRGQTYHQDIRSSPRFTDGEVKPTMRTSVLLHALRVERSNLPSGLAFFSTLYGLRSNLPSGHAFSSTLYGLRSNLPSEHAFLSTLYGLRSNLPSGHVFFSTLYVLRAQTFHQDTRSSPRFTGWEVKPTIRTCVPLHALRIESNLPSEHAFLSTLYGLRSNLPSEHVFFSTLDGLRSNLPSQRVFFSTLYGLRGQTYHQDMQNEFSPPRFTGWEVNPTIRTCIPLHALRVERSNLPSGHAFFSTLYGLRGQTYHQDMHSSPRFTGSGQTYHEDKRSSPRFTGWEVKPTIRTCVLLHALRVESPNLPSGHAFLSTLYGLRGQTYHQDMRSSPRFTDWVKPTIRTRIPLHALRVEVKPTIRTRIPLHALRVEVKPTIRTCVLLHAWRIERSNLPWGHAFFSTLYGLRGQTYHQDMRSSPRFTGGEFKPTMRTSVLLHALRVERTNLPSGLAFFSTPYGLRSNLPSEHAFLSTLSGFRSNLPWGQAFFSTLYGLRGQTYHQDMCSSPRFTGWEVKPTIRTCVPLHALRVERSNLPSGHTFFSTLYGWRGQTYHEDKRSCPRFTGWEVKPTIRSCVLLHALRVESSNLPSGHVFFSTLYGLRGQTYYQDMCSSPRFMGWEVDPTIRTCIPLHASRVERSNLPSGHTFFSTLYGWRGQTYHEDKRSSPRFTGWEVRPTIRSCVLLHALRVEVKPTIRTRIPLHALRVQVKPTMRTSVLLLALRVERSNLPSGHVFFSALYGLRGQIYHQDMCSSPRFTDWEVKPTMRTCVLLHALRVERSNLPSRHAFFSTLYGWRVQTYHEDKRSSPHFTGWEDKPTIRSCVLLHALRVEVKPTIRTRIPLHALRVQVKPTMRASVLLHALRVERSNLPSGHVFFSTLYGLRGQTYYQDMCSSPRFTGWEVKPTIRTYVLLHALRMERSNLPWGQAFFSTLYGLRGQTYHQVLRSSPRFTGWGQTYHQNTHSSPRFTDWGQTYHQDTRSSPRLTDWGQTYHQDTRSPPRFTGWGQTYHQNTHSSPRFTDWGQTYHQDMCSSPRFTCWEPKPTIRTRVPLHAFRIESNLPSEHAFLSTLYGLRSNLPSEHVFFSTLDGLRSNLPSQRVFLSTLYGLRVKPTIRTCRTSFLLHALRVERSILPSGHAFLSTLYGLRGQTYHQDMRSFPRFTGWEVKPTIRTCIPLHALRVQVKPTMRTSVLLHALRVERSNLPSGHVFFSTLYGLRGQTYYQDMCSSPRFMGWEVDPTIRTCIPLHALRVERSNLPSGHMFFSTLYGWRGQTYHEDKRSSPRFTGWEVKPTIRSCVLLHALRVEVKPTIRTRIPLHALRVQVKPTMRTSVLLHALRVEGSNLPSGHVFFSTLYGLRGQTYHQDMCSSPRFTGWEVKPTIRTCVLLHALRVERSNLLRGQAFFSTLYGLRGQTYHQVLRSSPRFTGWEVKPTIRTRVPLHALWIEVKPNIRTCIPLHALRVEVKHTIRTRIFLHALRFEVKPNTRTRIPLHALRVERSNLPSGHVFFSTLYGWRGQTYHEDKRCSPRFTGWEVKPRGQAFFSTDPRSNLPSEHVFFSTLYGLRGQT